MYDLAGFHPATFTELVVLAFGGAGIPLYKLRHGLLRKLLETGGQKLPHQNSLSSVQAKLVPQVSNVVVGEVGNNLFSIFVDGTPTKRGSLDVVKARFVKEHDRAPCSIEERVLYSSLTSSSSTANQQGKKLRDMMSKLKLSTSNLAFCMTDAGSSMLGGVNKWLALENTNMYVFYFILVFASKFFMTVYRIACLSHMCNNALKLLNVPTSKIMLHHFAVHMAFQGAMTREFESKTGFKWRNVSSVRWGAHTERLLAVFGPNLSAANGEEFNSTLKPVLDFVSDLDRKHPLAVKVQQLRGSQATDDVLHDMTAALNAEAESDQQQPSVDDDEEAHVSTTTVSAADEPVQLGGIPGPSVSLSAQARASVTKLHDIATSNRLSLQEQLMIEALGAFALQPLIKAIFYLEGSPLLNEVSTINSLNWFMCRNRIFGAFCIAIVDAHVVRA